MTIPQLTWFLLDYFENARLGLKLENFLNINLAEMNGYMSFHTVLVIMIVCEEEILHIMRLDLLDEVFEKGQLSFLARWTSSIT